MELSMQQQQQHAYVSTTGLFLILFYGFLTVFLGFYFQWRMSPLRKIPGPPTPSFLIGYMVQIFREPFMDPHNRWWRDLRAKHHGSNGIPLMRYSSLLGRYSLLVFDPNLVQLILTEPASRDPVRFAKNYFYIREIIGMGLVTLEGDAWSRHRRIIQPSFQTDGLKESLNRVVPRRTQTLIDAWRHAEPGAIIDVSSHMSAVTLDIIGDVAFSHEFGATRLVQDWADKTRQEREDNDRPQQQHDLEQVSDPLIRAFAGSLMISPLGIVLTILGVAWIEKYLNRKVSHTRRLLNEAVDNVVRKARRPDGDTKSDTETTSGTTSTRTKKSLLQLLFEAKDHSTETRNGRKTLSDTELRDEVKTFVMAGHETTATWCYWALYAIAKHPDVQQKLYDEIVTQAPDASSPVTLDQVDNMPYLSAFLSEILRLYTPVAMIVRHTTRTETLSGYTIPSKTRLVIPIHLLHRHPDYWNDPDEFRPERWLDENEAPHRHRFCFLPFSAGGRNCIGQRFAEIEAKIMVANIARAFTIQLAPSQRDKTFTFTNMITMKSKPLVKICVKAR